MRLKRIALMSAAVAAVGFFGWSASAQQTPNWGNVGPIFAAYCTGCHGGALPRAGLDLRNYESALAGSSNGPVMVAGDSANSLLIRRIRGEVTPQMPRGRPPLSDAEIAWIGAWIDAGMPE